MTINKKIKITYTQSIALGFLAIILTGAILLSLPIASREGAATPFLDSLFTAVSATCVTGLVVYDTFSHWSVFGQIVILIMIQTGGLGFMTVITMFSIFLKRRISLHERRLLMQSAGMIRISGAVRLIKRILIGTLIFEGTGAILMAFRFCPEMGFTEGLYNAIFHSISAFCNAGFDLMGKFNPYSSLMRYQGDWLINLVIMSLIVLGGIGFLVWNDISIKKQKFEQYELHTKIVLVTTAVLLVTSAAAFFVLEKDASMKGMNTGQRILASMFQAVTPRTAGFNTVDMSALSESGNVLTVFLMLVGGSPGSTAGGIKTTTLMVMITSTIAAARQLHSVNVFKRRLDEGILHQAAAIVTIYIFAVLAAVIVICHIETLPMKDVVFEVGSAIGTVGLSVGLTSGFSHASRIILMVLMFGGRVGGLSLMVVFAEKKNNVMLERPPEKILIG